MQSHELSLLLPELPFLEISFVICILISRNPVTYAITYAITKCSLPMTKILEEKTCEKNLFLVKL